MVFHRKLGVSYTRYIAMLICDTTGWAPAGLEQNGVSSQAGGKLYQIHCKLICDTTGQAPAGLDVYLFCS